MMLGISIPKRTQPTKFFFVNFNNIIFLNFVNQTIDKPIVSFQIKIYTSVAKEPNPSREILRTGLYWSSQEYYTFY